MMRHLCSIMRINWMDKVTNKDILARIGLPSMEHPLIRKNVRWTVHLMRMSPDRFPNQILYSQQSSGHRKRGRPRLRFKDTMKRDSSFICLCQNCLLGMNRDGTQRLHQCLLFTAIDLTSSNMRCVVPSVSLRQLLAHVDW